MIETEKLVYSNMLRSIYSENSDGNKDTALQSKQWGDLSKMCLLSFFSFFLLVTDLHIPNLSKQD